MILNKEPSSTKELDKIAKKQEDKKRSRENSLIISLLPIIRRMKNSIKKAITENTLSASDIVLFHDDIRKALLKHYLRTSKSFFPRIIKDAVLKRQIKRDLLLFFETQAARNSAHIVNTSVKRLTSILASNNQNTMSLSKYAVLISGIFKATMETHISSLVSITETQLPAEATKYYSAVALERFKSQEADQKNIDRKKGYKMWLTMMDDRVRLAHQEAAFQKVPVEAFFRVDGENLLYPRDPSGSLSNIAGCRCTALYVIS